MELQECFLFMRRLTRCKAEKKYTQNKTEKRYRAKKSNETREA